MIITCRWKKRQSANIQNTLLLHIIQNKYISCESVHTDSDYIEMPCIIISRLYSCWCNCQGPAVSTPRIDSQIVYVSLIQKPHSGEEKAHQCFGPCLGSVLKIFSGKKLTWWSTLHFSLCISQWKLKNFRLLGIFLTASFLKKHTIQ